MAMMDFDPVTVLTPYVERAINDRFGMVPFHDSDEKPNPCHYHLLFPHINLVEFYLLQTELNGIASVVTLKKTKCEKNSDKSKHIEFFQSNSSGIISQFYKKGSEDCCYITMIWEPMISSDNETSGSINDKKEENDGKEPLDINQPTVNKLVSNGYSQDEINWMRSVCHESKMRELTLSDDEAFTVTLIKKIPSGQLDVTRNLLKAIETIHKSRPSNLKIEYFVYDASRDSIILCIAKTKQ
jgi:hypothetical protein